MKTLIAAASALALTAAAVPAFAQSANATVNIGAEVAEACGNGNHKSGASSAPGWAQGDITIANFADINGQVATQEIATNHSFGNLWCNTAAEVTMTVSALTDGKSAPADIGSFTNSFDIEVNTDMGVYLGGAAGMTIRSQNGADGSETGTTNGAFETGLQRFSGVNSIKVLADASGRRPVAGTYSGSITVTASAN